MDKAEIVEPDMPKSSLEIRFGIKKKKIPRAGPEGSFKRKIWFEMPV